MNVKKTCVIIGIVMFLVLGICFGAYRCGAVDSRNNIGVEGRAAEISGVRTELGNEQRANKERLDRIYQLTVGTDETIGKLRESNRRSGDLLSLLEQEVDILEDYINSMRRELAGYRGDAPDGGADLEIRE